MKAIAVAGTFFIALAGCASQSPQSTPAQPAEAGMGEQQAGHEKTAGKPMGTAMMTMCPMQLEGTQVSASDTENGLKMSFTTSSGDVARLREHVRKMAAMHTQGAMGGPTPGKGEHQGMAMDGRPDMMVEATATAKDIAGGAELVLVPKVAADLQKLRTHARMMADKMQRGECPMMQKQAATGAGATDESGEAVDHASHH